MNLSGEDYLNFLWTSPPESPADAIEINSDRMVWVPPSLSGAFGVKGDMEFVLLPSIVVWTLASCSPALVSGAQWKLHFKHGFAYAFLIKLSRQH